MAERKEIVCALWGFKVEGNSRGAYIMISQVKKPQWLDELASPSSSW